MELRDYQAKDVQKMCTLGKLINANQPGLGKTLETLVALQELEPNNILVIGPKVARGVWKFEADKWLGWDSFIYEGTPKQREQARLQYETDPTKLLVTNFAKIKEIIQWKPKWDAIVVDEAHLGGFLNHKSKTFKDFCKFECTHLFVLTGTPVRKGPQDLWPMLHLMDRKKFKSYWSFVNTFCMVHEGMFGKEILGKPKEPVQFNAMLQHYMIRRKKVDVLTELPPKVRQPIPIEMTKKQRKAYKELLDEMMLALDDAIILTSNVLTRDLRLRQLLVCPRLLGIDEDGAAIEALVSELLPNELEVNGAALIGTPFRQAVPYVIEAITKELSNVKIFEIHGGVKESASDVANKFQNYKGQKILIFTIKSGASWTAHSAASEFFLGYEWSTNDMEQAEDRIHRLGQVNTVHINYLLHANTIDEAVLDALRDKSSAAKWILEPKMMLEKLRQLRLKNIAKYDLHKEPKLEYNKDIQ